MSFVLLTLMLALAFSFFLIKSSVGLGPGEVQIQYIEYSSLFLIWKEESMSIFLTFSGSWAWSPKENFIQFALAKQETVGVNNVSTSFLVSDTYGIHIVFYIWLVIFFISVPIYRDW